MGIKSEVVGGSILRYYNFNDGMSKEIKEFYKNFVKNEEFIFNNNFLKESKKVFLTFTKKDYLILSDAYFNNFTAVSQNLIDRRSFSDAFLLWTNVIKLSKDFEKEFSKDLHKGTPYYFASVAAIYNFDFDAAFILMHLALEEDKKNQRNYKEKPAYCFLTLNNKEQNQYFRYFVNFMTGFIKDRLDGEGNQNGRYKKNYRDKRNGKLTYEDLQIKFLNNDNLDDEIKFYFVYSVIKLWRLRILHKSKIEDDIIAPLIFIQEVSKILIIIESLFRILYPKIKSISNGIEKLVKEQKMPKLNPGIVTDERDKDFDEWVDNCLIKDDISGDLELIYGLRNYTFHNIKSQKKIWEKYTEVIQSVWNCFFFIIEKKY